MPGNEDEAVTCLFAREIPEIAAGLVEIEAIAHQPGSRAKVAVRSCAPGVDAIGVCVGELGCRIRRIVDQLGRERIDLVLWDDSPEKLIANALQPARIEEVALHPAQHRATVVVRYDQLCFVTGSGDKSRGLFAAGDENRELASRLCGWQIGVVTQ